MLRKNRPKVIEDEMKFNKGIIEHAYIIKTCSIFNQPIIMLSILGSGFQPDISSFKRISPKYYSQRNLTNEIINCMIHMTKIIIIVI